VELLVVTSMTKQPSAGSHRRAGYFPWQGAKYVENNGSFYVMVVVACKSKNSLPVQDGRYGWRNSDLPSGSSEDTPPVFDMWISCSESLLTEDCSTWG
jgi:hypothetical protein